MSLLRLALLLAAAWTNDLVEASGNNSGIVDSPVAMHDKPKRTDMGIAVMLLGGVSFMMAIFYLVNHSDADVKRYSWRVLSATISIFCAVLIFQACNGVIEYYAFKKSTSAWFKLTIDIIHSFVWLAVLQAVLAHLAGFFDDDARDDYIRENSSSVTPKVDIEKFDNLQRNMKTTGVLLGHITGFAAINAWGTLQQIAAYEPGVPHPFHGYAFASCSAVFAAGILLLSHQVTHWFRLKAAMLDDGEVDAIEWLGHTEIAEIENDVFGLTVSFLLVQLIRFVISGELPSDEEEADASRTAEHSLLQVMSLISMGFFFGACVFAHVKRRRWVRVHSCFKIVWSMSFAWCFYYSLQWLAFSRRTGKPATNSVIASLLATMVAFGLMRVLDYLADKDDEAALGQGARAIIESLGILVGFSWEKSFDVAVDSVAEGFDETYLDVIPEPVVKLGLALGLCIVVLPAWRWYILPIEIELEQECKETAMEIQRSPTVNEMTDAEEAWSPLLSRHNSAADADVMEAKRKQKQAVDQLNSLRREAKEEKLRKQYDDIRTKKKELKKKVVSEETPKTKHGENGAHPVAQETSVIEGQESEGQQEQETRLQADQPANEDEELPAVRRLAAEAAAHTIKEPERHDTEHLSWQVRSLTEEIDRLKASLSARGRDEIFRSASPARFASPASPIRDDADIMDMVSRTGTSTTKLSLQLANVRRELQDRVDHCCQLERDVALLRVDLSDTYRNFWSSFRYPRSGRL